MKKMLLLLSMIIFGAAPVAAQDSTARSSLEIYDEGPVWHMIFMRTAPGQRNAYLDSLSGVWSQQVRLAEEMGFVLRHHVITKWPSSPDDWDVLLIEVFPNMAAYDSFWEDWARVDAQILADREVEAEIVSQITAERRLLGVQIAREITLNPPGE